MKFAIILAASLAAAAAGVGAGGVCGLANGLLVTRLKLPPFVATLGPDGAPYPSGQGRLAMSGVRLRHCEYGYRYSQELG